MTRSILPLALLGLALAACSGDDTACPDGGAAPCTAPGVDAGPPACTADFSGNATAHVEQGTSCATVAQGTGADQGTWVLTVAATAPSVNAPTKVHIDLGNTPAAGSFDPTNVAAWDALTLPEDNCEYSAGAMTVPTGTFSLTLTALDGLPDAPVAHGTLHVQMHVASPPGVDCGAGDTELVDFTF